MVPLAAMWPMTREWYGDRVSSDFRPKSVATLQGLLTSAGLTSDFWQL